MVETLALEPIACPLCGATHATPLWQERDVALGVPGLFPVARCADCGLLYQNPRVRIDDMARMYPADYPPHARNPDVARALADGAAVRTVLAGRLGYRHLAATATWRSRVTARLRRRRIEKNFPPWVGEGRLLDVGCATGRFLQRMKAIGWRVSGIELDPEAAATAKTVTPDIVIGDPSTVTLPAHGFDLITAFHVIEHLPDPLGALRNMLGWLAPGGLMIVEVPNTRAAGAGASSAATGRDSTIPATSSTSRPPPWARWSSARAAAWSASATGRSRAGSHAACATGSAAGAARARAWRWPRSTAGWAGAS